MHPIYIQIISKLGTASLSERALHRMVSSLLAFTPFSILTLYQIHSFWILFCFILNMKAQ